MRAHWLRGLTPHRLLGGKTWRTRGVPAANSHDLLRDRYLEAEAEVHGDLSAVQGHWHAFKNLAFYEDGLFTAHSRAFEHDPDFEQVYSALSKRALGYDPHHRWRAHVFSELFIGRMPGVAVELGSAQGFMLQCALGLADRRALIEGLASDPRTRVIAVDKFDNLAVDPVTGIDTDVYPARWRTSVDAVRETYRMYPFVEVVQGRLPEALDALTFPRPIDFLHIDLNAADPTVLCLESIWPRLAPGGIVLFDDYGHHDHTATLHAVNAFTRRVGVPIVGLPTQQAIVLVPPSAD